MKNKFLVGLLSVIGLIFALIGLILSFLPLGTIDIVPAVIGLLIGVIVFLATKATKVRRKLVLSVIIVSLVAILISVFTQIFIKNEVVDDQEFIEKVEKSEEEAIDDLEDALEGLE